MGAAAGPDWTAALWAAAWAWRDEARGRKPREGLGPDVYPGDALAGRMVGDVLTKRMWLDMRYGPGIGAGGAET